MSRTSSIPRRTLALTLVLLGAGACGDEPLPTDPTAPPDALALLPQVIACRADVVAATVACERPTEDPTPGLALAVTLGGQGIFVQLTSDNVSYDGSLVFQADVTVQNLIGQALATTDGTTVDPDGVRVFFHSGPTVPGGTGTVTVANADGTGTFTGTNQPYFQYDELLATGATSAAKTWEWAVQPSVTTFDFEVYVTGEVQHPNGWVETTPGAVVIGGGATQRLTSVVKDVIGREQAGETVTYASSNETIAEVDASGLLSAMSDGSATITASSGTRAPAAVAVTVTSAGVTRVWVGGDAAGASDWANPTNWLPAGTPAPLDTVQIPSDASTMPALTANTTVGRVEVASGATADLVGYTLTVTRDVVADGEVTGPGLVVMTGAGCTLEGLVPSVRVTGSVELVGSVTVLGSLTVRGGSLNEKGFHLLVRQPAP
ncbi:MAG: Ig-like domain-containing protein [Gemmatimonadota bacterium]|nr:Ig-like domain-containing protein [Gemmatimonadota bacterium]